jgi:carbonic anhydrase
MIVSQEDQVATDTLLEQTRTLRADFFEKEGELIGRLARQGQKPKMMFVGCADSRVIPERLTGARPGDLFVVRNVANIIPPFGAAHSVGAALEYAVNQLGIAHLIICGHTECGGLKALDGHVDALSEPSLTAWLQHAREAKTRVDRRNAPPDQRHRAMVEQNIVLQMEHAARYPAVYKALKDKRLELHGWLVDLHGPQVYVYNPATGRFESA